MTVIEPAQEGGYRAAGTGWELLLDRPAAGLFTFRAGKNLEIVLHGAKLDDLEDVQAVHHNANIASEVLDEIDAQE